MRQRLLVALDGSPHSEAALQYGVMLARAFGATLRGVHVVDIVQVESPLLYDLAGAIGAAPQLNLTALMRQNLELRGQQLLATFRRTCEDAGVACETQLAVGVVPHEILRAARDVDLILMGRGGLHTRLSKALLGSAVERVVRHAGKPTLVSPEHYAPVHRLLVATDGSPSATAALDTAVFFAQRLGLPLHVVHCSPTAEAGQACLEAARARLAASGVACSFALCPGNPHEDLVSYILEHGYDLVFIGAFGHRRIVEWLLGSTTRYLLRVCPMPLVLCHAAND
ncbi:MAG: universal stress protein [Candidatus Tectimicrobiota bacterium]|nr:MAG: universal stress protein [Candidatus Tectomicrobia bacterium]